RPGPARRQYAQGVRADDDHEDHADDIRSPARGQRPRRRAGPPAPAGAMRRCAVVALVLALAPAAGATNLPDRTFRISTAPDMGQLDGDSGDTSLSADGQIV